jgi:MoxR-like ATPase
MKAATATATETTEYIGVQDVVQKLQTLFGEMDSILTERTEVLKVLFTALVAKQHAVLLGPPGVGKSTAINMMADQIGIIVFKKLLTRFTDVSEIFGPESIKGLMEDEYRRALMYGADSPIWFLDEVWKANSALLNALLTSLEERAIDNGGIRHDLPLVSCFAASNEPPQDESLAALRDRFTFTVMVEDVSLHGFMELMQAKASDARRKPHTSITETELRAVQDAARNVRVNADVLTAMGKLRRRLLEEGVSVSTRRQLAGLDSIKAYALMQGSSTAELEHMAILSHVLWTHEEEREIVRNLVREIAQLSVADKAAALYQEAESLFHAAVEQMKQEQPDDRLTFIMTRVPFASFKQKLNEFLQKAADPQEADFCKEKIEGLQKMAQQAIGSW